MNNIEFEFFKYCCKQADYNKTVVYSSQAVNFWQLNMYTQRSIITLCAEYASIKNISKNDIVPIINNWFKKGIIGKNEYAEEDKFKYFFIFNGRSKYSRKLYNICPYRTINLINRRNPNGYQLHMASHPYNKRKLKKKEKEIFRFIIRRYNIGFSYIIKESENFNSDYIRIQIPNYNRIIAKLQNRYSKRCIKKYLRKWNKKSIIRERHADYAIVLLDLHKKMDEAYVNAIPHNIFLAINNRNSE